MERWDLYDENRNPLGRTHIRGVPMEKGTCHIVVFVWVFSGDGRVLMTKRAPEKKAFPNLWEHTGGSVLAGETSLRAVQRELFEETGICARQKEFIMVDTFHRRNEGSICDIYFLKKYVPADKLVMQPGETCDARWVTRAEYEKMIAEGIVAAPDVRRYYQLADRLKEYI